MLGTLSKVLKRILKKGKTRNITTSNCLMKNVFKLFPNLIVYGSEYIRLGKGVSFNDYCHLTASKDAEIIIGDDVLIGPFVVINTGDHNYKDGQLKIREQGHIKSNIIIGTDVWIGARVTILRGARVENGCVIAANTLITRHVKMEPYGVYGGNPIRLLSRREQGL
jgi:acetyltransferase-like isoleucine patch superfamily enzyme